MRIEIILNNTRTIEYKIVQKDDCIIVEIGPFNRVMVKVVCTSIVVLFILCTNNLFLICRESNPVLYYCIFILFNIFFMILIYLTIIHKNTIQFNETSIRITKWNFLLKKHNYNYINVIDFYYSIPTQYYFEGGNYKISTLYLRLNNSFDVKIQGIVDMHRKEKIFENLIEYFNVQIRKKNGDYA